MNVDNDKQFTFKAILAGEAGVGKTSIFVRIKDDVFDQKIDSSTVGESYDRTIPVDDMRVTLQIWDTAGTERFRSMTRSYYRTAHVVFMLYSVDDHDSLRNLSRWVSDVDRYAPEALRLLVGNKTDLDRLISNDNIQSCLAAEGYDSAHTVSALNGEGIDELLQVTAEKLLDLYKIERDKSETVNLRDRTRHGGQARNCC